jgi:hypothetical protein
MNAPITFEFTPQAEAVLAGVKQIPQKALQGIARGMDRANQLTVGVIQKDFLNFPKGGPTSPIGLRHQSGHLKRSVRASKAVIVGESVISAIGSNVKYAGVHEYGFNGRVNIPAHTRKPGRSFLVGGKLVSQRTVRDLLTKAGKVRKKAGLIEVHGTRAVIIEVKAHTKVLKLPARSPIRRGIAFNLAQTKSIVSGEVVKAINGGGQ